MKRRGMILIIVLVVVAALSLGALAFSSLMVSEREVVYATGRGIQTRALAESGIERARLFLNENPNVCFGDGLWFADADAFQGILVVAGQTPRERGRFSIVAPASQEGLGGVRFGLTCESAKLNLNTLLTQDDAAGTARQRLLRLPGMSEEIADCILDWLDPDDEPREFGAEADYYESLSPPYRPGNEAFRCLEELLFVRGVTPELLYGADKNRNGAVDADESADASSSGSAVADSFGWSAFLTLYSRENIVNADGEKKVDLNQTDAQTLFDELKETFDEEWATFIVAYRQQEQLYSENSENKNADSNSNSNSNSNGNSSGNGNGTGSGNDNSQNGKDRSGGASSGENKSGNEADNKEKEKEKEKVEYQDRASGRLDLAKPLRQNLGSVLDLIGCKVKVTYAGSDKATVIAPLFANDPAAMREYLPRLTALADAESAATQEGRINVNLAPVDVLAGVPGMNEELAEEIVGRRPEDPLSLDVHQHHATWLLIDGLVTLDEMKKLLPYLTAGGSVFTVQSVGFYDQDGPVTRLEAVLDATESPPRVLFLKDLTPLGRGFDPLDLGAE